MKKERAQSGSIHAIVPLNVLKKSKARLSPLLNRTERIELTLAMLADVLSTLRQARSFGSITVVSADKNARRVAKSFGAKFLWEGKRRGLNKGLRMAIRNSERRGARAVLVIHADLPLLTPREIQRFLMQSRNFPIALTPSKDGNGTDALLLRPPQIIGPVFGKNSFRRHLSLATRKHIPCKILRFRGISFDVDEPKDLLRLMNYSMQNQTGRFVKTLRDDTLRSAER